MRVPVYERRIGINPMPQPNIAPVIPTGDGGASAAKAIQGFTDRIIKLQQDHEDAKTLEAFNKFKEDSLNYHEDPDKGILNTRLGGEAQGVYSDADRWMRQKGEDYAMRLGSNRAKANFRRMATDYILQRGQSNSRFEAEQIRKFQSDQADATIKNGLNDIAANPYDESAVENNRQIMSAALELKYRYSSPEQKKQALAEMENQIATTQLNRMLQDNPLAASKWFNENKDKFTGDNAVRATQAVKNATEIYRTQAAVDELVKRFPQGHEQEGLKWIREHYSGDEEERIAAAYKTRQNELSIDTNKDARLLRLQQDELAERLERDFFVNGRLPSDTDLRTLVNSGRLRVDQAERLQSRQVTAANRARIEREILAKNPNMTPLELDNAVMSRMGTTNEEYQRTFAMASQLVLSAKLGDDVDNTLDYLYHQGKLTRSDVERLKNQGKAIDEAQRNFYNSEKKDLDNTIKALVGAGLPDNLAQGIRDKFSSTAITSLNPRDKDYREQLLKLKKQILIDAIDASGENLSVFGLWQNRLGTLRTEIQDQTLQSRGIDPFPALPEIQATPLNLTPTPRAPARPSGNTSDNIFMSMVAGGSIPDGGRFSSRRSYRNGTHQGLDIAAPAGTDIILPNLGTTTDLTVTRVNTSTPSRGAGNTVTLEGTLPNGDVIELTLGHMQRNSINVDRGQTIPARTLIGKVGNTGMTSDREKGGITAWYEGKKSGYHVDIKLKLNGRLIDPETYNPADYRVNTPAPVIVSPDVGPVPERMSSPDIFYDNIYNHFIREIN